MEKLVALVISLAFVAEVQAFYHDEQVQAGRDYLRSLEAVFSQHKGEDPTTLLPKWLELIEPDERVSPMMLKQHNSLEAFAAVEKQDGCGPQLGLLAEVLLPLVSAAKSNSDGVTGKLVQRIVKSKESLCFEAASGALDRAEKQLREQDSSSALSVDTIRTLQRTLTLIPVLGPRCFRRSVVQYMRLL